mgnify:CR=1 FL=1
MRIRHLSNKKESEILNKKWELVNFCEFDKYATKSYCAIHNVDESKNLGDITKVDENELDDFNMMTWGFPCTDISVAGKQKGFINDNGEKTRSGMYYEGIRILRKKKPALSIIENVKNLTGKRFKNEFEMVLSDLDNAGYNSYWKVLNAKNYGIPQNRERVFIVSIRKDLDNGKFKFPEPFDNGLRLKDLLEDEVDERFYISDEKTKKFIKNLNTNDSENVDMGSPKFIGNVNREDFGTGYAGGVWDDSHISPTLTTMQDGGRQPHIITGIDKSYNNPKLIETANCITSREDRGISNRKSEGIAVLKIGNINPSGNGMNGSVYSEDGLSPTLTTNKGEGNKVAIKQATKQGYIECEVGGVADLSYPDSKTRRGRVQDNGNTCPTITATETGICRIEKSLENNSNKLTHEEWKQKMYKNFIEDADGEVSGVITNQSQNFGYRPPMKGFSKTLRANASDTGIVDGVRIRKLTPKETFRLMGFSDKDFDAAQKVGISNSQLYKQAGNSIVVDVLYYIYRELYIAMPYLFDNLKLSSFFSGIGAFEIALDRLYKDINSGNFMNPQTE